MSIPSKWPIPQIGQVLAVTRRHGTGWVTAYFWPAGDGFHYVTQAYDGGTWCIEDASHASLHPTGYRQSVTRTCWPEVVWHRSSVSDASLLTQLNEWRLEILGRAIDHRSDAMG